MSEIDKAVCPECNETVEPRDSLDRRDFLRAVGVSTAAIAAVGILPTIPAVARAAQTVAPAANQPMRAAEALIRELWGTLNNDQRAQMVKPWDHRSAGLLSRQRMVNQAIDRRIGQVYTRGQQDLLQRILKAMCSDERGYDLICRRESPTRAWDDSHSFDNLGADIFGEVAEGRPWSLVFTGHHLTVRCDGSGEPNCAFGGPIYYGHSPDGYSQRNLFNYQTQGVLSVFDSLNERQRHMAVVVGTPGELEPSVRLRPAGEPKPGIPIEELSRSQRWLVYKVMRDVLSPFRKEDGDAAMDILQRTGGLDRIHLAFYRDRMATDASRWHFWRLEGPGFVWNYRVLPHVHTYVNIVAPQA